MSNLHRINIVVPTGSGRRVGWVKLVQSVDVSKRDGYAFSGPFLKGGWNDLEEGSIVIEQIPSGSVKNSYKEGKGYRVVNGELQEVAYVSDWYGPDFLPFRDKIANATQKPIEPTTVEPTEQEVLNQLLCTIKEYDYVTREDKISALRDLLAKWQEEFDAEENGE